MTKLRNIFRDYEDYFMLKTAPDYFVFHHIFRDYNGTVDLSFQATYSSYDGETFHKYQSPINIKANKISFADYVTLLAIEKNAKYNSYTSGYDFSDYLSYNELIKIEFPVAYAGEYIGSKETVQGNLYNTTTDTYGAEMGNYATNMYFLYIEEFDKYVVVKEEYLDI